MLKNEVLMQVKRKLVKLKFSKPLLRRLLNLNLNSKVLIFNVCIYFLNVCFEIKLRKSIHINEQF